jgi:ribosomal protein L7/L12
MSTGTQILFGVAVAIALFAGVSLTRRRKPAERRPVTPELDTRLRELVADGKTIVAIKELRLETGMGLREAKEHVLGLTPAARRRDDDRVGALLADGKKIQAIKELREQTGMGLREAKEYVDALEATGEPPAPPRDEVSEATMARARQLAAAGKVVHAVKAIRDETGWSLKRCKDIVDGLR